MNAAKQNSCVLCAPATSYALGARIAARLGMQLTPVEEREFGGGEHKIRPLAEVRGRNAYVIHSLNGDAIASANDKLCRLLFLVGALRDAGAAHITACLPYLAFSRKDRRSKQYDPVNSRYVAQLLEAVGVDRVVVVDVHNVVAFENAFRCESVSLSALEIFAAHFAHDASPRNYAVVSPDVGGIKRARFFQEILSRVGQATTIAFMDKKRSGDQVSGEYLVGDVQGREVIIVDDLISSGGTIQRAVTACRLSGAVRVHAAATHAVFSVEAHRLFASDGPDSIIVTDSAALDDKFTTYLGGKLRVVEIGPLLAETISALECGTPLAHLTLY